MPCSEDLPALVAGRVGTLSFPTCLLSSLSLIMPTLTEALASIVISYVLYKYIEFYRIRSKIDSIPTVGSDSFVGAYINSWRYFINGRSFVKEGYYKYPGAAFKVPTLGTSTGWQIIISGKGMIDELRKAPLEAMTLAEANVDTLQTDIIISKHSRVNEFQTDVVRTPLTRALAGRFGDIRKEIIEASKIYLPVGDDWEALPRAHGALLHIVCRTANRLFVGLPLCRDPEYLKIQEDWTVHLFMDSLIIHAMPSILKPVVGRAMSKVDSLMKRVQTFLEATIVERMEKDAKYGPDWEGKPADLISWLLDYAPPENRTVEDITVRVMFVNAAAVHTTTMGITNVLFELAARQEYIKPIREEISDVVRTHGWTKEAMLRLHKLDSFIKESFRLSGMGNTAGSRKTYKDFTFSNGVTIPKGYSIAIASGAIHFDPAIYPDPDTFNGWRFCDTEDTDAPKSEQWRNQVVTMDPTWLMWGVGRHACPGRFFAVNEIKAMVCHILSTYDIKLPGDATVPPAGTWFGNGRIPDSEAAILFRKRRSG